MLYGVYHDLVHQNPGDHLYEGIEEDSKWQAHWEKLVYLPTQHYDAPYGKVGNRFVVVMFVELDRVPDRKWNSGRMIVFRSYILQCAQNIKNSTQI